MKRDRRAWFLFAAGLALGLAAMAWTTRVALRSERAAEEARLATLREERVRVGIAQMETALALFLDPENIRPYFHYDAFHGAEQVFTRARRQFAASEILIPSPMLIKDDPLVLLRFQIDAAGTFTAPLVPGPDNLPLALQVVNDPQRLDTANARLGEIRSSLSPAAIREAMPRRGVYLLSVKDLRDLRASTVPRGGRLASPFHVNQGSMAAFWNGSRLILARQVWVGEAEFLQCAWLDWPSLKDFMRSAAFGDLPEVDLAPLGEGEQAPRNRTLALLPVKVLPGTVPLREPSLIGAVRMALALGWLFALAGGAAGALVIRKALRDGERREAFASTVSHELRSPLTTFRLYTELLAHDMVPEPAERQELLRTLLQEADRLDHVVKNILAFARMESRRGVNRGPVALGELLGRAGTRLAERAGQSSRPLEVVAEPALAALVLETDPTVVEQILLNLVDNACKYAAGAQDPTLRLDVVREGPWLRMRFRDHGPGIPPGDVARIFLPFRTPSSEGARRAPGIGLGLALCRRLAKALGGKLELDGAVRDGAGFVLSLPLGEATLR